MRFDKIDELGNTLISIFQRVTLFGIGIASVFAAAHEFIDMFDRHVVTVQDLLLMFIFLEIIAMVGIYFNTSRMPVRFVMYIAIAAMTRYLADVASSHGDPFHILLGSATILLLSCSVWVVKYSSSKFPPGEE
jgi:protein PsiE